MTVTPNNVLPQVGQVAFQPNVGVPEGGVYQSLALGMQMMDQPVRQRIALEQLEQVKANTELDKQRLDMQIQEFDFRKEQIERANLKELEEYRNGAYTKANALFGLQTLTDEEDAILSSALEKNGVNQTAIDMLLTGSEAQARDVNANIQKAMGDRDVMKIFQKNEATKALMDAYTKCPTCFDGAAVTAKIREAHVNPNLAAKDFHPSKFVNRVDPEDQLKSQFEPVYSQASADGKVHVERKLVDRIKEQNPNAVMTDEQGTLLPEWQTKVDYILGKNTLSTEELAKSLTYLTTVLGFTDPKQIEAYTRNAASIIESARAIGGERGAREMLNILTREANDKAEAIIKNDAAYSREQLKSDTKLTLQANEPVTTKTPKSTKTKMSVDQYGEAVGAFFGGSLGSESKQAAKYMYQKFNVPVNNQEEANKLQAWVKEAGGNPNLGTSMYLTEKALPVVIQNKPNVVKEAVKKLHPNAMDIQMNGGVISFVTKKGEPRTTVDNAALISSDKTNGLRMVAETMWQTAGTKSPTTKSAPKTTSSKADAYKGYFNN